MIENPAAFQKFARFGELTLNRFDAGAVGAAALERRPPPFPTHTARPSSRNDRSSHGSSRILVCCRKSSPRSKVFTSEPPHTGMGIASPHLVTAVPGTCGQVQVAVVCSAA